MAQQETGYRCQYFPQIHIHSGHHGLLGFKLTFSLPGCHSGESIPGLSKSFSSTCYCSPSCSSSVPPKHFLLTARLLQKWFIPFTGPYYVPARNSFTSPSPRAVLPVLQGLQNKMRPLYAMSMQKNPKFRLINCLPQFTQKPRPLLQNLQFASVNTVM